MKFSLPGPETITMSVQTIDKLIRAGNGEAALLYLHILRTHGKSTTAETAAVLGKSHGEIATSMAVLSRLNLVQMDHNDKLPSSDAQADSDTDMYDAQPRRISVDEMRKELQSGSVFYSIVEEAQLSLGKILSPDELMRLFGIFDSLRMAPEVILMLMTHCITESRGRSGGRMPSMRYIEKAAYTWEREGIDSLEKAEVYLKANDMRKSVRWEIKNALQIKDREFSETEKRYVDNWIVLGFDAGAVAIAYDRTLVKTGKLVWNYIDSIMKSWHSKGLHTPREIMEKDTRQKKDAYNDTKPAEQKFGSADQEDIQRMQRLLDKIKDS